MILSERFPSGVTLSNPTSLGFASFICRRDGLLDKPHSSHSAEETKVSCIGGAQQVWSQEGDSGCCLQSLCPMRGTVPVHVSAGS